MNEYEGGGEEKHPTPHIALNSEGLPGVWAICELGDREECARIAQLLLWVEVLHWLIMAGFFLLNLTNQCEGSGGMFPQMYLRKNICNSQTLYFSKSILHIIASSENCSICKIEAPLTPNPSHHATQFTSVAVEYY